MDAQGYISPEEVRQALRQIYSQRCRNRICRSSLLESFSDELKPIDEKGRWKPSPLLILTVGPAVRSAWGLCLFLSRRTPMSPYYDQPALRQRGPEDVAGVLVLLACAVLAFAWYVAVSRLHLSNSTVP